MDDLKCGICLELFQDPRSLPCLHTFCRECIQRSLNEENHSLNCPVCRAKHKLGEGAGPLPVNQYALQELPLQRLQQQREDNGGPHQLVECKSCGEQAVMVAWCYDCDAMICQQCSSQHEKMSVLRGHRVIKSVESKLPDVSLNNPKTGLVSCCPKHLKVELKYCCLACSELVCSECLLGTHKGHKYSLAEKARHNLATKMKEMTNLVKDKAQEFSKYIEKANKAEGKALEYSELMKSEVNNVFDGIAASVEAQRNEALQSVSQDVKEIWSQKEMMEVSLAQLDSFNRFSDHTHKCTTDTSYVAMACQAIKLMEQLMNIHGDQAALSRREMVIIESHKMSPLKVPLDSLFALGRPSLKFSPAPGSELDFSSTLFNEYTVQVKVSLEVGGKNFPDIFSPIEESCKLVATASYNGTPIYTEVKAGKSFWTITATISCIDSKHYQPLVFVFKLSGTVTFVTKIQYTQGRIEKEGMQLSIIPVG